MTAPAAPVEIPGRVAIAARVYERLARQIGATELGVRTRDVSARVADDRGLLAVQVTGPARAGGRSVLERVSRTKDAVTQRLGDLTGAQVARVAVHVTDVVMEERRTA